VLKYTDVYHQENLLVTGVMHDMPANSHLHLDFIISYGTSQHWNGWNIRWGGNTDYVYILLNENANAEAFAAKMPAFSRQYLKGPGNEELQMKIQPLQDIHLYSNKTFEAEPNGSGVVVYMLLSVGIFILIIACVNFINISTARSVERAKEVGIRKIMGSQRAQLIKQFLLESLLVNVLALILATTLVQLLFPLFDRLTGKPVSEHELDLYFQLGWVGLFVAGAFLSGLYPALVLSGFTPVTVLKGKFSHSPDGLLLRKSLVVFQFVTTIILVSGTFTVYNQLEFMQHKDLGININQTLVVYAPNHVGNDSITDRKYVSLKNELKSYPSIGNVSVTQSLPGNGLYEFNSATGHIKRLNDPNPSPPRYFLYTIDENFVSTLGMKLLAGRSSFVESESKRDKMIINEAALYQLGFSSPQEAVNQSVKWWDETREIIGVVANYHHHSLDKGYDPMLLCFEGNYRDASYVAIKLNLPEGSTGKLAETITRVRKVWNGVFPESTFNYFFLDEKFNSQYKASQQFGKVFSLFAGLAIIVACLGLFGLSSFSILQRTKEIGVRKVLGASISNLVILLSNDFIKLILIANLLAWPLGYLGANWWLQDFAFRIEVNIWLFLWPSVLIVVIALVTISFQTFKTARANPIRSLRYE
jgi:putative ABC transport system permease protein